MKKTYLFKLLLPGLFLTLATGCADDLEKGDYDRPLATTQAPVVTTVELKNYGTMAQAVMKVDIPEGTEVSEAGFIVSQSDSKDIVAQKDNRVVLSNVVSGQEVKETFRDLEAGKTYYVTAYAYSDGRVVYGETMSMEANDDFGQVPFLSADLEDENLPIFDDPQSTVGGYATALDGIGLRGWSGWTVSVFHPGFFTGSFGASIVSRFEQSFTSIEVDLTGKMLPAVSVTALNIAAVFGTNYQDAAGNYTLLISKEPLTSFEDIDNATEIADYTFPQDATADEFTISEKSYMIPEEFNGKCYLHILSWGAYGRSDIRDNFGTSVLDVTFTSLEKKAAE